MTDSKDRLSISWWALRIGLGVGPIITGLDKYFNKLADWGMYLSPLATKFIPVSTATFMHVIGAVEILAGVIVLSRWTRIGSYIVMGWLVAIAVNLVTTGMFYDLAMRDVEIAIGAFALSQLTAVRELRTAEHQQADKATGSQLAAIL
jgi:DoxX.